IFTVGCNFSCKFCHNKYLLNKNVGKEYTIEELTRKIQSNLLVSSVSITGGEPTLQNDLIELCKSTKKIKKYINIDTNGSKPNVIVKLLPFIDRVALDLKTSLYNKQNYEQITGFKVNLKNIDKTIHYINESNSIDFEIRTTFVEPLLKPIYIHEIINYLREIDFRGNYVLQQYQYSDGVGKEYIEKFQKPEHGTLLNILKLYKDQDLPFKIYLRDDIIGYSDLKKLLSVKIADSSFI
ncbi:MAG: radical SAM protein, partial [Promethearchaeota archaeon]